MQKAEPKIDRLNKHTKKLPKKAASFFMKKTVDKMDIYAILIVTVIITD